MDDIGLLSKPGCWSYNPYMGEYQKISESAAVGEESAVSQAEESVTYEPSMTCDPSISEGALGYVSGAC